MQAQPHGLAFEVDVTLRNTKGKIEMFDFIKRVLQRRLQSVPRITDRSLLMSNV